VSTVLPRLTRVTDDVRWLDAGEQRAWRAWLDAHAALSARLNRELQSGAGLSLSDYDVLVHLTDVPESRLRAYELGHGLQWEKSRVSRQVSRMAERGLVAREAAPEDGRGAYVVLTAAGREAIEEAAPAHVELVRRLLFEGLTAADVRTLEAIAGSVVRRLDQG
jgi:DNA-binding MarR family transcriptional regulator